MVKFYIYSLIVCSLFNYTNLFVFFNYTTNYYYLISIVIGYIITTYCGLNIYWIYYKTFYFYLWTFIVKVMPLIISILLILKLNKNCILNFISYANKKCNINIPKIFLTKNIKRLKTIASLRISLFHLFIKFLD